MADMGFYCLFKKTEAAYLWVSLQHLVGSRWLCLQKRKFYGQACLPKNSWYLCFQARLWPLPNRQLFVSYRLALIGCIESKTVLGDELFLVFVRERNTRVQSRSGNLPSPFLLTAILWHTQLLTELLRRAGGSPKLTFVTGLLVVTSFSCRLGPTKPEHCDILYCWCQELSGELKCNYLAIVFDNFGG